MAERNVMASIARLVPPGSRVLDLGCGDGALMAHLQATRACTGYGVEIDDAKVLACVKRGVNVLQLNLEDGLSMFGDDAFAPIAHVHVLHGDVGVFGRLFVVRQHDLVAAAVRRRIGRKFKQLHCGRIAAVLRGIRCSHEGA